MSVLHFIFFSFQWKYISILPVTASFTFFPFQQNFWKSCLYLSSFFSLSHKSTHIRLNFCNSSEIVVTSVSIIATFLHHWAIPSAHCICTAKSSDSGVLFYFLDQSLFSLLQQLLSMPSNFKCWNIPGISSQKTSAF